MQDSCRLKHGKRQASYHGYVLQDSCNVLLQQYLVELMDSGQHSLMPVYACHLRADERREVSMILLPCRPDEVGLGFKSRVCRRCALCLGHHCCIFLVFEYDETAGLQTVMSGLYPFS